MTRLPLAIAFLLLPSLARAVVPSPTLEGPVTGGRGAPYIAATFFDLSRVGYQVEEYFISGTAAAFTNVGPLGSDGKWTVSPGTTAAYKTRIVVYRPTDPQTFNGTVFVEWLNVSGGLDAAADWITGHVQMIREGAAWVGVSAQKVGVEGGGGLIPGLPDGALKTVDPARYGSLVHPGDSFSYDIYSQTGQAVRSAAGQGPLGPLVAERVIAIGESQSAFRLVTYINGIHPVAGIYDGFLVHSRGGGAAPLSEAPQPDIRGTRPALIRTDQRVPVLTFQTETDLTLLQFFSDRQPDSRYFRLWEVAGTSHADTYTLGVGFTDLGDDPAVARLVITANPIPGFNCGSPVNSGPQHFVLNAALHALDRWVRRGAPPARAPRLKLSPGPAPPLLRDEHGNVRGGIRTAAVDAPIATLSGEGQTGSAFCIIFGTTFPFDDAKLSSLYASHRKYVSAANKATKRAVRKGFLLKEDAQLIKAEALASDIAN